MRSGKDRLAAEERQVIDEFTREVRERLGPRVARIILYGSRARGEADAESDYDVVVLLKEPDDGARQAVRDVAIRVSSHYSVTLVALVYAAHEFSEDRLFYLFHEIVRDGLDV